jgi:FtsZ-interacting cell division protein YlmF
MDLALGCVEFWWVDYVLALNILLGNNNAATRLKTINNDIFFGWHITQQQQQHQQQQQQQQQQQHQHQHQHQRQQQTNKYKERLNGDEMMLMLMMMYKNRAACMRKQVLVCLIHNTTYETDVIL